MVAACGCPARFPTPAELGAPDLAVTGLTGARRRTLRALAEAGLRFDGSMAPDAMAAALLDVPGIGPWTASYVALRLGDTDAFPAWDAALRSAAAALGLPAEEKALLRHAERWRPWRAYAAVHLWRSRA